MRNPITRLTRTRWWRPCSVGMLLAALALGSVSVSMLLARPADAAGDSNLHADGVIPGQTTHATPGVAAVGSSSTSVGTIYVAYTGDNHPSCTRACHSIFVTYSTDGGNHFSSPTELTDTAQAGTGVAVCAFNGHPYLLWAGSDSAGKLYVGYYVNNQNTLKNHTTVLDNTTTHTPTCTAADNNLFAGWVGTTGNLNLLASGDGLTWNQTTKYTFTDTASSGFGFDTENTVATIDIAWAGTDNPHHINWGRFPIGGGDCLNGSPSYACQMVGKHTDSHNWTNTDVQSYDAPGGCAGVEGQVINWKGSASGPDYIFQACVIEGSEQEGAVTRLNELSITGIGGDWDQSGFAVLTWADSNADLNDLN